MSDPFGGAAAGGDAFDESAAVPEAAYGDAGGGYSFNSGIQGADFNSGVWGAYASPVAGGPPIDDIEKQANLSSGTADLGHAMGGDGFTTGMNTGGIEQANAALPGDLTNSLQSAGYGLNARIPGATVGPVGGGPPMGQSTSLFGSWFGGFFGGTSGGGSGVGGGGGGGGGGAGGPRDGYADAAPLPPAWPPPAGPDDNTASPYSSPYSSPFSSPYSSQSGLSSRVPDTAAPAPSYSLNAGVPGATSGPVPGGMPDFSNQAQPYFPSPFMDAPGPEQQSGYGLNTGVPGATLSAVDEPWDQATNQSLSASVDAAVSDAFAKWSGSGGGGQDTGSSGGDMFSSPLGGMGSAATDTSGDMWASPLGGMLSGEAATAAGLDSPDAGFEGLGHDPVSDTAGPASNFESLGSDPVANTLDPGNAFY